MPNVWLKYTGTRPCLAQGRHLAPGDLVEVRRETAHYFVSRGQGEIIEEPNGPAVVHREPAVVDRDPKVKKR
jgi:hypothetical protein